MNRKSATRLSILTAGMAAKVFLMFLLFALTGCDEGKYYVILAIDAKEYRPTMTWEEIREIGFKRKHHTMRVSDAEGHGIPLYRYMHEARVVIPLDEAEIHISTPIIIEKKYEKISLSVFDHGNEVAKVRVLIDELRPVKGEPTAYVIPLNLP